MPSRCSSAVAGLVAVEDEAAEAFALERGRGLGGIGGLGRAALLIDEIGGESGRRGQKAMAAASKEKDQLRMKTPVKSRAYSVRQTMRMQKGAPASTDAPLFMRLKDV